MAHEPEPKNFEPKEPVKLDPPKDDPLTLSQLQQFNGADPSTATYVAIKGTVFDVTGNENYTTGPYKVFSGKDASRALALSSVKPEDVRPEWEDLGEKEKKVLEEWMVFFSKRYNIVGKISGS